PYPALPAILSKLFAPVQPQNRQRVFSCAARLSRSSGFYLTLPHNLATAYKVFALGGDDRAVENSFLNANAAQFLSVKTAESLQVYGVRYMLFAQPQYFADQRFWIFEAPNLQDAAIAGRAFHSTRKLTDLPDGAVFELRPPAPLAYVMQDPSRKLVLNLVPNGATVDVSSVPPGLSVGVNFLARPWLTVELDGKLVRSGRDDFGRAYTILPTPEGGKLLTVRYGLPWPQVLLVGAVLVAVGCAGAFIANRKRMASQPEAEPRPSEREPESSANPAD
ncbi:MAG: hypothetical protein ACRD3W_03820, partial [Terriglobales bacterium]